MGLLKRNEEKKKQEISEFTILVKSVYEEIENDDSLKEALFTSLKKLEKKESLSSVASSLILPLRVYIADKMGGETTSKNANDLLVLCSRKYEKLRKWL